MDKIKILHAGHIDFLGDILIFETATEWVSNITDKNGVWAVEKIVPLDESGGSGRTERA